jgi:hypothetical protein
MDRTVIGMLSQETGQVSYKLDVSCRYANVRPMRMIIMLARLFLSDIDTKINQNLFKSFEDITYF